MKRAIVLFGLELLVLATVLIHPIVRTSCPPCVKNGCLVPCKSISISKTIALITALAIIVTAIASLVYWLREKRSPLNPNSNPRQS